MISRTEPSLALEQFIRVNREDLIRRCRAKVARRSAPQPTETEISHVRLTRAPDAKG